MSKYNTLANARNAIMNHMNRPSKFQIILGDDGLFWVVSNRQASKLVAAGMESIGWG